MTKQIKIEELIPFMKKGWVACDKGGNWWWYSAKPKLREKMWHWFDRKSGVHYSLWTILNIAPAEDWTKSLIRINKGE